MEEKKLDLNSIIGFVLIFGILIWMMYQNQPSKEQLAAEKAKNEKSTAVTPKTVKQENIVINPTDTSSANAVQIDKLKKSLGSFAYSATLPSTKNTITTLENEYVRIKISNKGGYIVEAVLKNFEKFKKGSGQLVELIKDNNSQLNIQLLTNDNHTLNTKDLFFEPTLTKVGDKQILTMRLKAGPNEFLEYQYELKPNDYMVGFNLRSQGLNKVLNTSKPLDLEWDLKTYKIEKSASYENRYTLLNYEYGEEKFNNVSDGENQEETLENVKYIAYKQHFFASILMTETPFSKAVLKSNKLVIDEN